MAGRGNLAPDVARVLFVNNLSYDIDDEDLFPLLGKFGPIRQVQRGISPKNKGSAYVVYEDVLDAKAAYDELNGFNFHNRYLVVRSHDPDKMRSGMSSEEKFAREQRLEALKNEHGID